MSFWLQLNGMSFFFHCTTCSLPYSKRPVAWPSPNGMQCTPQTKTTTCKTPRTCCLILQHPVNMKKHKHPGHTTIGCSFLRRDNGNSEPPCFNHLWDTQRRRACDTENNPVALLPWHQHLEDARVVNRVFGLLPLLTDSYLLGF